MDVALHNDKTFVALRLIAIIMLLLAFLGGLPYVYFTILRYVVTGTCAYGVYLTYKSKQVRWPWVFGVIAIVFNPFAPLYLNRGTWLLIDLIVAGILVASLYFLKDTVDREFCQ